MTSTPLALATYHLGKLREIIVGLDPGIDTAYMDSLIADIKRRHIAEVREAAFTRDVGLTSAAFNVDSSEIRVWLRANGWPKIGTHGRFSTEQLVAYGEAHSESPAATSDAVVIDLNAKRGRNTSAGEIRSWAGRNGYRVSDRGPLPRDVHRAYHSAHTQAI